MILLPFSSVNSAQRDTLLSPVNKAEPELAKTFPNLEQNLDALVLSHSRGRGTPPNTGVMSREAFPGFYAERDRLCDKMKVSPKPVLVADLNNNSTYPNAYTTRMNVGKWYAPKHVSVMVFNRAMLEVMGAMPEVNEHGDILKPQTSQEMPSQLKFAMAHEMGHQTGYWATQFKRFVSGVAGAVVTVGIGLGIDRLLSKNRDYRESFFLRSAVYLWTGAKVAAGATLGMMAFQRYEETHSDKEAIAVSEPGSGHSTMEVLKKISDTLDPPPAAHKKSWFHKLWEGMNRSHPLLEARLKMTDADHRMVEQFNHEHAAQLAQIDRRIDRLALIQRIDKKLRSYGEAIPVELNSDNISAILKNERTLPSETVNDMLQLQAMVKAEEAHKAMPLAV